MSAKLLIAVVLIIVVGYFVFFQKPTINLTPELRQEILKPEVIPISPLEFPDLRWNHMPLRVFIDQRTPEKLSYIVDAKLALEMWEDVTNNLISFELVDRKSDADITIEWVQKLKSDSLDAAGNADLKFYNHSNFKIISKADIQLLNRVDSTELNNFDMANLAIHEIGHALGLSHNDVEDSIMNPTLKLPSKEIKNITTDEIKLLLDIYKVKPKPDIYIVSNSTAVKVIDDRVVKKFHYINAVITIENRGLVDSPNTTIVIKADGVIVKEDSVPEISVGAIFTRTYVNLLVEEDFNEVEIVIDSDNLIEEFDERNNRLVLKV